MKNKRKRYSLDSSCFYRILSKKKLCGILFTNISTVQKIIKIGDKNYVERCLQENGKIRKLQLIYKQRLLYKIHKRIAFLLSSIQTTEYLFSGVKGRSYIDNSKFHLENSDKFVAKLDIKSFFPSVKSYHIFSFFHNVLQCSSDVSGILTKLSTYNNRLPTGSPLSMSLAYYACKEMFDTIEQVAKDNNCKMSLWVDDIVISGNKSEYVSWEAKKIIVKYGLEYNKKKSKIYPPQYNKEVTGNILTPDKKIRLRNRSVKKIYDLKIKKNKSPKEIVVFKGCVNEARQIEPRFNKLYAKIKSL
jgi:RNA-directed DNA polymerase